MGFLYYAEVKDDRSCTHGVGTTMEKDKEVVVVRLLGREEKKPNKRQGRPKGSKNKKTVIPEMGHGPPISREGKHFFQEEALQLAEAWVHQSHKVPDQTEVVMW